MIEVRLVGEGGNAAGVSPSGELFVAQPTASVPVSVTLVASSGAHNICKPVPGKEYRISDIVISTDKGPGANEAEVIIYEATTEDETTVDKLILRKPMLKNDSLVLTGLHWKVTEGKFLNVKTDDDVVDVTIAAHLVDAFDDNPAALGAGADA